MISEIQKQIERARSGLTGASPVTGSDNAAPVIPGHREAMSPESKDSPMCNGTSEVWC
jgi:hypothetical protein